MNVAVVGNDSRLILQLAGLLEGAGHRVQILPDPARAFARISQEGAHLVVVAGAVPREAALELARMLRAHAATGRAALMAAELEGGASESAALMRGGFDDVILRPMRPRLFLARAGALLRRRLWAGAVQETELAAVESGALTLRPLERAAFWRGREIQLTRLEFELLSCLARSQGRPVARPEIAAALRSPELPRPREIERQVEGLRRKLGPAAALLRQVGEGYVLVDEGRDA